LQEGFPEVDPTLSKQGRQDLSIHENVMTLVQIAFIFMNDVAAFSSIASTARARSADCNERGLMQCAIVSKLEPEKPAWSINSDTSLGMNS
jgi:hypothetical protein